MLTLVGDVSEIRIRSDNMLSIAESAEIRALYVFRSSAKRTPGRDVVAKGNKGT